MRNGRGHSFALWGIIVLFLLLGCASGGHRPLDQAYEMPVTPGAVLRMTTIAPEIEKKIRALDPESVSNDDVNEILAHAPAPRIFNIHGGIYPVHLAMESFSKFLIFMGYPEEKIQSPVNGTYSYSCYESSEKLAGLIAWYYEREGLRPMMIGHSQGGIQTVKVLHQLAGTFNGEIPVWNPVADRAEDRHAIIDPLTGKGRAVTDLHLSYASAVGSGGITRFLPNQWEMMNRLRSIPDSVVEFTGFYMGMDVFGGDLLGFGPANRYSPNGKALVRNVRLPASYSHVIIPVTRHLAKSPDTRDWINRYVPSEDPELTEDLSSSTTNILWAADVWHSIKKHWVMELQNLIEARDRWEQAKKSS